MDEAKDYFLKHTELAVRTWPRVAEHAARPHDMLMHRLHRKEVVS